MENTTTKIKYGSAIKILSLLALVFTILSNMFRLYARWTKLTFALSTFLPLLLFVLYFFVFYKKSKAAFLVPIIFGSIGLCTFINMGDYGYSIINECIMLAIIIYSIFLVICSIIKIYNKPFITIFIIICMVNEALCLIEWTIFTLNLYADFYFSLDLIPELIIHICMILFYIALLLFGLNPLVLPKQEKAEEINIEEKLESLKIEFELGVITEEEYQVQRADIISKL